MSTIASTPQSATVVDTSVTDVVNVPSNTIVNKSSASNANELPVLVCTNSALQLVLILLQFSHPQCLTLYPLTQYQCRQFCTHL